MNRPLVIGVDASLTSTGLAGADWTAHIIPKVKGHERLQQLITEIGDYIKQADLVVIEGPSYGSGVAHRHEDLAGLRVMLRHWCWRHSIPYAVVPPSVRAMYATGRGNASKGEVRTCLQDRYGMAFEGKARYDEADAFALAALGLHWLGQPLADVPDNHARALTSCTWPETAVAR